MKRSRENPTPRDATGANCRHIRLQRCGPACRAGNLRPRAEMHRAIAGKSFDVLTGIPLIAGPAAFAKVMHDAISGGIYAAIHHGATGVFGASAAIERQLPEAEGSPAALSAACAARSTPPSATTSPASAISLAIDMGLHVDGRPV